MILQSDLNQIAPMPEQGHWTYEDWLKLPSDGWKYEVLDGVLHMTPPPTFGHQDASAELLTRMRLHARKKNLGKVVCAPVGVRLPGQAVPLEPDIVFVRKERLDIIGKDYIEGSPDLVVEILSPSNWTYDRREKFRVYQAAKIPEYWIVDCRARTIDLFLLEGESYALKGQFGEGETVSSSTLANFSIGVSDVFGA